MTAARRLLAMGGCPCDGVVRLSAVAVTSRRADMPRGGGLGMVPRDGWRIGLPFAVRLRSIGPVSPPPRRVSGPDVGPRGVRRVSTRRCASAPYAANAGGRRPEPQGGCRGASLTGAGQARGHTTKRCDTESYGRARVTARLVATADRQRPSVPTTTRPGSLPALGAGCGITRKRVPGAGAYPNVTRRSRLAPRTDAASCPGRAIMSATNESRPASVGSTHPTANDTAFQERSRCDE